MGAGMPPACCIDGQYIPTCPDALPATGFLTHLGEEGINHRMPSNMWLLCGDPSLGKALVMCCAVIPSLPCLAMPFQIRPPSHSLLPTFHVS